MKFNYLLLGDILKRRRIEKGLSKNKLAQYVGISQPEVTRIENGIRAVPNIVTLINLCEVLGIDFIRLLKITGFVDKKNRLKKGFEDMKKYNIVAKKIKEIGIEVEAENEEMAVEMVEKLLQELNVFDMEIPKLITEYTVVEAEEIDEDEEDYDEEIEQEIEETSCEDCEYYCSVCGNCTYKD